jgi:hypothetical protein
VEENANLVVRLLIRRPECLGPALRGEGGGLLMAMKDSILMSLQIAAARDHSSRGFLKAVTETKDDDRGDYLQQRCVFSPNLAIFTQILKKKKSVLCYRRLCLCVCVSVCDFRGSRPDGSPQETNFADRNTSLYF